MQPHRRPPTGEDGQVKEEEEFFFTNTKLCQLAILPKRASVFSNRECYIIKPAL